MADPTRKDLLLTGASSGIGAAIARQLAGPGYRLALTARRLDRLEALAIELRARGAEVATFPADLGQPEDLMKLWEAVQGHFGGGLDLLVNNAGHGLPKLFGDSDPADLRAQVEVNFTAPAILTRLALPALLARQGMVINIGSSITSLPNPVFGLYGASKAALAYWNDALRREVRHRGVRVCLVEPGPVGTEFFLAIEARSGPGSPKPAAPSPPGFALADVDEVARRVVRLIEHPRRRLSVLKRFVWPWRLLGGVAHALPVLGDLAISRMVQGQERAAAREGERARAGGA